MGQVRRACLLAWLIGKEITPHVTVRGMSTRKDGTFSRSNLAYDPDKNVHTCPAGNTLKTTGRLHAYRYLASKIDCSRWPLKQQCCPNMPFKRIPRDVNEVARDVARALAATPEFEQSGDDRKEVEMRFAHFKTHHRAERIRLRGLSGARDEFHHRARICRSPGYVA